MSLFSKRNFTKMGDVLATGVGRVTRTVRPRPRPLMRVLQPPSATATATRLHPENVLIQYLPDTALTAQLETALASVDAWARAADEKYQQWMVKRVDPIFGGQRHQQLTEISGHEQLLAIDDEEKSINRSLGLAAFAFTTAFAGISLFPPLLLVSSATALYLLFPLYKNAWREVKQTRAATIGALGALEITGYFIGGYWMAAPLLTFAINFSHKLIRNTEGSARRNLVQVFGQQPKTVWVYINDTEIEVPFAQLEAESTIVVHAGQMIPVDGVIVDGIAAVDQQMLTGEAQPTEKSPGDPVFASTVVLAGKIYVRVEKTGEATTAAQIVDLLNNSANYTDNLTLQGVALANRSVNPTLLLSALAWPTVGFAGALAVLTSGFGFNLRVISPLAMLNLLNIAARQSILVKDGRALEQLQAVDTVVFDKTGTLTLEQPHVVRIYTYNGLSEAEVLTYAAAAERRQTHPIARAILDAADDAGLIVPEVEDTQYEIGYGIKVWLEQEDTAGRRTQLICVGSERFMQLEEIPLCDDVHARKAQCQTHGHSVVMVAVEGQLVGVIELQPTLRPETQAVIEELHKRGLKTYIISGDQEEPTRKLAADLGIDSYFANTLPENKATLLEQLQKEGHTVCFVGDGINDGIALRKANISISLRGATTVATDAAQIVLMQQDLSYLITLLDLAQEFRQTMKAGFWTTIVPGVVCIGGVFFLHFGVYAGLALYNLGFLAGLTTATLPLLRHRGELSTAR